MNQAAGGDTAVLRQLVEPDAVERFLDDHGLGSGPVSVKLIGGGHSNLTYLIERGALAAVLRRPPRPPFPRSAHDVLREAKVLKALKPAGVRVPAVLACCEDTTLIGAPFYITEYIDGDVVGEPLPESLANANARRRFAEAAIDALVQLHAVDPNSTGLKRSRRAGTYAERQVQRFSDIWDQVRTRQIPEVSSVRDWLRTHLPASPEVSVAHGDYRLGNLMVGRTRPDLLAILDWEMATIGDPLADLGYLCATWAVEGDEENPMTALSRVTLLPGFPSPADLAGHYALASGRDISNLRFYEVLALFKATGFLESSYRRFLEGRTQDQYFAQLDSGVPILARHALRLTQGPL